MTDDERAELMLWDTPRKLWPQFADAMAWSPDRDVPSWMAPGDRKWFWREVDQANREAVMDAAIAKVRADLEAVFAPWMLRLASIIGRVSRSR